MNKLLLLSLFSILAFNSKANINPSNLACDGLTSVAIGAINYPGGGFNNDQVTDINFKFTGSLNNPQKIVCELKSTFGVFLNVATFYATHDTTIKLTNSFNCQNYYFIRARMECADGVVGEWKTNVFDYSVCYYPNCPKITFFQSTAIDGSTEKVSFSNNLAENYLVEYKPLADSVKNWLRDSVRGNVILLKNLKPSTIYLVRAIAACRQQLDTTPINQFTTLCASVTDFKAVVTNDTVVSFKWKNPAGGGKNLGLKIVSDDKQFINIYNLSDSSFSVKDLPQCKSYTAIVLNECADQTQSPSQKVTFVINGCNNCKKPTDLAFNTDGGYYIIASWKSESSNKFIIQYKLAADSTNNWFQDTANFTTAFLTKIHGPAYNKYVGRVLSFCNDKYDTSNVVNFSTLCLSPYDLRATVTNDTIVNFTWRGDISNIKGVVIKVYSDEFGFQRLYYGTGDNLTVTDLPYCTTYTARIKPDCDSTDFKNSN